jgi:hypothetical protein
MCWQRFPFQFAEDRQAVGAAQKHGSKNVAVFFRISHGRYSGASDHRSEFESREAAWSEITKVCANLLGGISRSPKPNAEWHMELLDESKQPVFRIRLVAESLG